MIIGLQAGEYKYLWELLADTRPATDFMQSHAGHDGLTSPLATTNGADRFGSFTVYAIEAYNELRGYFYERVDKRIDDALTIRKASVLSEGVKGEFVSLTREADTTTTVQTIIKGIALKDTQALTLTKPMSAQAKVLKLALVFDEGFPELTTHRAVVIVPFSDDTTLPVGVALDLSEIELETVSRLNDAQFHTEPYGGYTK